jgi:hypothetical protein
MSKTLITYTAEMHGRVKQDVIIVEISAFGRDKAKSALKREVPRYVLYKLQRKI